MQYHTVADAKSKPGLRLALSAGVPGPWGEAAKGIFKLRGVDYIPVLQEVGGPNTDLLAWTGHRNAPVAVYNDEKPRVGWAEILLLAERLGSGPSLVPQDPKERALMMGLAHEICGEEGLGWSRRLSLVHPVIQAGPSHPGYEFSMFFGRAYGYRKEAGEAADARCVDLLTMLSAQLAEQQAAGRSYLVGNQLSAADVYWATFAALIDPLPDDLSPMSAEFRSAYSSSPPEVRAAASSELMVHRDFIYESALGLPLDL